MKFVCILVAVLGLSLPAFAKTYQLDAKKSSLKWTGNKVVGKQHNGTVKLTSGTVVYDKSGPKSSVVTADMTSIANADLEGKWNAKLVGHLNSDDFFSTAKHKEAKLVINKFTKTAANRYDLAGQLTIKGITKPVTLKAKTSGKKGISQITADLEFDRTEFGVRYGSGKFFENLGDKMIADKVQVKALLVLKEAIVVGMN